ncbi:MAG: TolC family protein [Rhodanobacteraceae bacterium]
MSDSKLIADNGRHLPTPPFEQPQNSDARLSAGHLVLTVLQENQSVAAMRAASDAANAQIESAGALDDPMVSYALAPNTAGGPRQGLKQNLQISQKLPWPGTLSLRSNAAESEADSAAKQLADLRLRLAARTLADYAQWYYVHRALAVNAENVILVTRLRTVAETAYASGQSPQQDILQAEVELTRLGNQTLELKRLQRTVQARIDALQNLDPATPVPPPEDLPAEIPLPKIDVLRESALANHPLLQGLNSRVVASRDQVDLAHKNEYPQFNMMIGYNSLMDLPAKRLTVGVSVNIPFGANHRGEVDAARAHLREAEAKLADSRIQLLSDLDQAYATAIQANETIRLYATQLLPLAKLSLQAAEADYSAGGSDFLKLITAEQQYLSSKLELARARADFFTQVAYLNYQAGGVLSPPDEAGTHQESTP